MCRPSWPELQGTSVELNINGKAVTIDADPTMPLLWVLRGELGLVGTKFGCGMALCGACTVHVDGEPVQSCVTPVGTLASKAVTTIEGLTGPVAEVKLSVSVPAPPLTTPEIEPALWKVNVSAPALPVRFTVPAAAIRPFSTLTPRV